jgi:enoyl-CoA hydratase/carnithine racemase
MSDALLSIEHGIAVVTLNRPRRLNAIGGTLLADLHDHLARAQAEPEARVIVLTGAGRAFCAGDDLQEFPSQAASARSAADTCAAIQRITRDIMCGPKPVVGAVAGYAVGGGFEWMLNCDLVVAADDLICFFPEMALGHFVTGGVTHLLPRALGHQRAMELMLLGERLGAPALRDLGLVNRVVPPADLMPVALDLARRVAALAPGAVARLKAALAGGAAATLEGALVAEQAAAEACFADPETARRVAARRRELGAAGQ